MTLTLLSPSPEPDTDLPIDAPATCGAHDCLQPGRATYRFLTGRDPDHAEIDTDHSFDAHVLASILAIATTEDGALSTQTGLPPGDLDALAAKWFPHARRAIASNAGAFVEDEEATLLGDLLLSQATAPSAESRWLAQMVARRAVEPNHLWEDLGLRERSELTRLLLRHFEPLAKRNTNGMRWKRFFYRMLCEDDGFLMCATPVCTECPDFNGCFGEESGESRLARRRRDVDAKADRNQLEFAQTSRREGSVV